MAPSEICRLLGEAKFKEMFLSLSAAAMKLSLTEASLPTIRAANQTSTRKRNEDWAGKLWTSIQGSRPSPCKVFLFEWLRQTRTAMLAAFLDSIAVVHQKGLTDSDFMKEVADDKLLGAAQALLASPGYDRREVAAYLLFLEDTNETARFASLELGKLLAP
jgi:hypothetical protein